LNKEQMEERIAAIIREMDTMRLMHAKLEGHLNEAQIMLKEFEKKEDINTELHVGEYDGEANNETEECTASE